MYMFLYVFQYPHTALQRKTIVSCFFTMNKFSPLKKKLFPVPETVSIKMYDIYFSKWDHTIGVRWAEADKTKIKSKFLEKA